MEVFRATPSATLAYRGRNPGASITLPLYPEVSHRLIKELHVFAAEKEGSSILGFPLDFVYIHAFPVGFS